MYVSADFDRSDPWVGQSLSKLHPACASCFGLCQQLRPAHNQVAQWLRCTQIRRNCRRRWWHGQCRSVPPSQKGQQGEVVLPFRERRLLNAYGSQR